MRFNLAGGSARDQGAGAGRRRAQDQGANVAGHGLGAGSWLVEETMIAAASWPPRAPPALRTTVFTAVADPVRAAGTAETTWLGKATRQSLHVQHAQLNFRRRST